MASWLGHRGMSPRSSKTAPRRLLLAFHVHCGDISESSIIDSTKFSHRSVTVYGVLVGSPGYVTALLKDRTEKIAANIATARANMYP